VLAERDFVDSDALAAVYWPEFVANGKPETSCAWGNEVIGR
jgi:hypothetical protein